MKTDKSAGRLPLKPKLIVILGPTASGKTALSLKLALRLRSGQAKKLECEIISADSRAIYKKLDIGSAKPTKDQNHELSPKSPAGLGPLLGIKKQGKRKEYFSHGIKHHLIDVVEPDQVLTLAQYKKLAIAHVYDIVSREKVPFLVGGTALYIYAVIDNWLIPGVPPNKNLRAKLEKQTAEKLWRQLLKKDPEAKSFIDPKNKRRIIRALEIVGATGKPFSKQRRKGPKLFDVLMIGVKRPEKQTKKIIEKRTKQMLKAGLVREVKNLLKTGYSPSLPSFSGIHYKEIVDYIKGKITLPEAVALINKNDEQLVRRQMTWFKKDKRIRWVKNQKEAEKLLSNFIDS